MLLIYNVFILFYRLFIHLASATGNKKAKEWIKGRKSLLSNLKTDLDSDVSYIWFHCASAGEFEQGKPLIEKLKVAYPHYKILVSFFSPSGYKAGKKYAFADTITYLPVDTKTNAAQFIDIVQPRLVIFIKYEYWYHHLRTIYQRQIPLLMVSAIFRKDQVFFEWYGSFYRKMLHYFSWIFVQDEPSLHLLRENNFERSSKVGDTRFDRVLSIANQSPSLPIINKWYENKKRLIAGSTWPDDERILAEILPYFEDLQLIIAPHEITLAHINKIQSLFQESILYSQLNTAFDSETGKQSNMDDETKDEVHPMLQQLVSNRRVLIIDNIGMLSRLYQYATVSYIGGGFNKSGIHNTLEAAVWGKPVIFGPTYHKFKEARDLIAAKGAFSISNAGEMRNVLENLLNNQAFLKESSEAAKNYVHLNKGATDQILQFIHENRLLTN